MTDSSYSSQSSPPGSDADDATPLEITVCLGQTCSSFGNPGLLAWLRTRREVKDGRVVLRTQQCWARCKEPEPLCPCVRIGPDEFIVQAERDSLRQALRRHLPPATD